MSLTDEVNAKHAECQRRGGCVPGDETVSRMVKVKLFKGNTVEDYRDLPVCVNCGVPINIWRK